MGGGRSPARAQRPVPRLRFPTPELSMRPGSSSALPQCPPVANSSALKTQLEPTLNLTLPSWGPEHACSSLGCPGLQG